MAAPVPGPTPVTTATGFTMPTLRSELLLEGPNVQLVRPCAAVLVREEPERVGDRRRLQQVLVLRLREKAPEQRHVDAAVDIDVADGDPLRMEIARQHLRQSAHGELGRHD